ncbi:MAG: Asp-tRNA(Asn)/Glu-tRNA(Gln) amidotransferase subunit GatB [Candidatus Kappaea frigidicola]|nr:Asp-tRNA(Asn)/Glu-tRNA(Gln) amidotransferase subunit GatB [Candidatus Kappaea frigidicola]
MKYITVIGLEVHVQLASRTKIFCGCKTNFGAKANTQTCPVCLGLPGSLPVFNKKVLELSLRTAITLNCTIAETMKFDRKNYFYPDLPKAYQISQFDMPLATKGYIDIAVNGEPKRIGITRVHLEEDAGKLIHAQKESLIDFNRCGTPLIEIVSEPDLNNPEEAYDYLKKLKNILDYLEVSDCNMQEGSLRCDANISLMPQDAKELGTKVEIKNLNSFKAVRDALFFEIERQEAELKDGQEIAQETRLWDEASKKTISMRSKEEAHDYRYFPDPDLPKFLIETSLVNDITNDLPELGHEKKVRFIKEYSLSEYDAGILTSSKAMAEYYEKCLKILNEPKEIANWLIGPVLSELKNIDKDFNTTKLDSQELIEMIKLVKENKVNAKKAKEEILPEIIENYKKTNDVLKEKDILQVSDETELNAFIKQVISENEKSVNDYQQGKKSAIMYLVGQVMRLSKGKADAQKVKELLEKKLEA